MIFVCYSELYSHEWRYRLFFDYDEYMEWFDTVSDNWYVGAKHVDKPQDLIDERGTIILLE